MKILEIVRELNRVDNGLNDGLSDLFANNSSDENILVKLQKIHPIINIKYNNKFHNHLSIRNQKLNVKIPLKGGNIIVKEIRLEFSSKIGYSVEDDGIKEKFFFDYDSCYIFFVPETYFKLKDIDTLQYSKKKLKHSISDNVSECFKIDLDKDTDVELLFSSRKCRKFISEKIEESMISRDEQDVFYMKVMSDIAKSEDLRNKFIEYFMFEGNDDSMEIIDVLSATDGNKLSPYFFSSELINIKSFMDLIKVLYEKVETE